MDHQTRGGPHGRSRISSPISWLTTWASSTPRPLARWPACRSLEFFLGQARYNYDETIHDPMERNLFLSVREPLGVVVAYIAWNFPMGNLSMKLGAVLASGCTAVIKPANATPLSTLYVGEIMQRIGFPAGVINFIAASAHAR